MAAGRHDACACIAEPRPSSAQRRSRRNGGYARTGDEPVEQCGSRAVMCPVPPSWRTPTAMGSMWGLGSTDPLRRAASLMARAVAGCDGSLRVVEVLQPGVEEHVDITACRGFEDPVVLAVRVVDGAEHEGVQALVSLTALPHDLQKFRRPQAQSGLEEHPVVAPNGSSSVSASTSSCILHRRDLSVAATHGATAARCRGPCAPWPCPVGTSLDQWRPNARSPSSTRTGRPVAIERFAARPTARLRRPSRCSARRRSGSGCGSAPNRSSSSRASPPP